MPTRDLSTPFDSSQMIDYPPCTTLFITFLCFANHGSRIRTEVWRFEVAFGGVAAEATLY